jgi:hypothetical protein
VNDRSASNRSAVAEAALLPHERSLAAAGAARLQRRVHRTGRQSKRASTGSPPKPRWTHSRMSMRQAQKTLRARRPAACRASISAR